MKVIVVAGPTASGKTGLAVALAQAYQGTIISADSRQVYRGMDIGTGKDLVAFSTSSGNIPYTLIDIADPKEIYTLFHFQQDCYRSLKETYKKGTQPILCGGTGLYLEAVLQKYHIPNVPENIPFRISLQEQPLEDLARQLSLTANDIFLETDISSKKRVIRSLEIAEYRKDHTVHYSDDNSIQISPCIIAPLWSRAQLINRINLRLEERLSEGMLEEVQQLMDQGITKERMDVLGLEYREISNYLLQKCSYGEMVDSLAQKIHRFSKRQMTWFRGMERRGIHINWIKEGNTEEAKAITDAFLTSS